MVFVKTPLIAYRRVCYNGIRDIRKHAPDVSHSSTELFSTAGAGQDIAFSSVQAADKRTDARPYGRQNGSDQRKNSKRLIPHLQCGRWEYHILPARV